MNEEVWEAFFIALGTFLFVMAVSLLLRYEHCIRRGEMLLYQEIQNAYVKYVEED